MRKSYILIIFLLPIVLFYSAPCYAQKKDSAKVMSSTVAGAVDSILNNQSLLSKLGRSLIVSAYVDVYAAYYSDSVGSGKYQKFPAVSPRSNSFGVNIAQVTEQFNSDRIRSTATLQFGDLPNAAWSPVFNYIQEANIGVRLAKNLWIDGGFFKTHIGTEALLPKDNITSSVAMITFFEPWWQSGLRLVYTADADKFYSALYVVNGYNQFVATNKKKAVGLAISYNFSDNFNIGYYNFLSDNTPDSISISHWRFLNNLVFNLALGKKVKVIAGGDYIIQQNSAGANGGATAFAYSGIFTLRYQFAKKVAVYGRFEEFNDKNGILTGLFPLAALSAGPYTYQGYEMNGETLGLEYKPTESSYIRLESRILNMQNDLPIFYSDGGYSTSRVEVMLNMGIWF